MNIHNIIHIIMALAIPAFYCVGYISGRHDQKQADFDTIRAIKDNAEKQLQPKEDLHPDQK